MNIYDIYTQDGSTRIGCIFNVGRVEHEKRPHYTTTTFRDTKGDVIAVLYDIRYTEFCKPLSEAELEPIESDESYEASAALQQSTAEIAAAIPTLKPITIQVQKLSIPEAQGVICG